MRDLCRFPCGFRGTACRRKEFLSKPSWLIFPMDDALEDHAAYTCDALHALVYSENRAHVAMLWRMSSRRYVLCTCMSHYPA